MNAATHGRTWLRRSLHAAGISIGMLSLFTGVTLAPAFASACSSSTASCSVSGNATLTAGSLALAAPASISWSATLNGSDQSVGAAATLEPIDATGSGDGWAVTVTSTSFMSASPAATLPTSALSVNGSDSSQSGTSAPGGTCASGSSCTLPSETSAPVTYPLSVPAGSSEPTPVDLYTAKASTGEGAVNLASDWWLSIPGSALAATYTSTISLAIVSGP
jgi:hypothetical protein